MNWHDNFIEVTVYCLHVGEFSFAARVLLYRRAVYICEVAW